ncbi:MAG: universal stress protein [Elusimicrobiota bacterium]
MFPPKRVVIASDLSRETSRAADWARRMSAPGADFETLFVFESMPVPVLGLPSPPLSSVIKKKIMADLSRVVPFAAPRVEEGDAAAVIIRRARRADLLVMGSHGRKGVERALMGSRAESVIRDAPIPVLVARTPLAPVDGVLAPINLMPYSYRGLLLAAQAAVHLGVPLNVLHVDVNRSRGPNPRFFLNGMISRLPAPVRRDLSVRLVLRRGDPVREILAESAKNGLVVATAHRKSLLSDLVLGTTAERILRHSPIPVLTAPSGV